MTNKKQEKAKLPTRRDGPPSPPSPPFLLSLSASKGLKDRKASLLEPGRFVEEGAAAAAEGDGPASRSEWEASQRREGKGRDAVDVESLEREERVGRHAEEEGKVIGVVV